MEKNIDRLNQVIETAMKNLSGLIDVNTVIGKPIKTETNDLIIPVSKVTFGVLSGGGEYGKLNIFSRNSDYPHSAGNGAIVSVKPCAFLVKNSNEDDYTLLNVSSNSYEKIFDKTTNFIKDNIKNDKEE